jgi:hypothetical protein
MFGLEVHVLVPNEFVLCVDAGGMLGGLTVMYVFGWLRLSKIFNLNLRTDTGMEVRGKYNANMMQTLC